MVTVTRPRFIKSLISSDKSPACDVGDPRPLTGKVRLWCPRRDSQRTRQTLRLRSSQLGGARAFSWARLAWRQWALSPLIIECVTPSILVLVSVALSLVTHCTMPMGAASPFAFTRCVVPCIPVQVCAESSSLAIHRFIGQQRAQRVTQPVQNWSR